MKLNRWETTGSRIIGILLYFLYLGISMFLFLLAARSITFIWVVAGLIIAALAFSFPYSMGRETGRNE